MTVGIILAGKGREVVTIEPGASLAEAAQLLASKRIGAALILGADDRIVGIISERDVVRALARAALALNEPVSQTMTRKVETCSENETVASIMERMTRASFATCRSSKRAAWSASCRSVISSNTGSSRWSAKSVAMRDYITTA